MADIGGIAAGGNAAVSEEVLEYCKVVVALDMDWVTPKGVGALADIGGNAAAEEPELDPNEGTAFALGITKDDDVDACGRLADGNTDDKTDEIDRSDDDGDCAVAVVVVVVVLPFPEKLKQEVAGIALAFAGDEKDCISCLAFDATAAADGDGGKGNFSTDCIVTPGKGEVGIANSFARGAFFHRLRLTWKDVSELLVGVVVSVVAIFRKFFSFVLPISTEKQAVTVR